MKSRLVSIAKGQSLPESRETRCLPGRTALRRSKEQKHTVTRRQLRLLIKFAPQLVPDRVEQLDVALLAVLGHGRDKGLLGQLHLCERANGWR